MRGEHFSYLVVNDYSVFTQKGVVCDDEYAPRYKLRFCHCVGNAAEFKKQYVSGKDVQMMMQIIDELPWDERASEKSFRVKLDIKGHKPDFIEYNDYGKVTRATKVIETKTGKDLTIERKRSIDERRRHG